MTTTNADASKKCRIDQTTDPISKHLTWIKSQSSAKPNNKPDTSEPPPPTLIIFNIWILIEIKEVYNDKEGGAD